MRHADRSLTRALLFSAALVPAATSQDWVQILPSTVPTVRNAQGMAYDLARRQVVMFGGAKDGSAAGGLNDTWTWDGVNWTQQNPTNVPPTRAWPGMSYDQARSVVVMFGGRIHAGPTNMVLNDLWEWDGTNWAQVTATNPPAARYSATMTYDTARGVHVIYSGVNGSNVSFDETWEYNGATRVWTQRMPTRTPLGRVYAGMAYDQSRQRCVLYGGADDAFVVRPNLFWEWDGVDWTSVTPVTTPGDAQGHILVYDTVRQRIVIQGGQGAGRMYRIGTWEYDGVHCYAFNNEPNPAPGSWVAAGAFDWVRARMVVFGGFNTTGARTSLTWERDPRKASFATFGRGCAGSGGTPDLRTQGLPALGNNFVLDIRNLPSSGGIIFVLLGFNHRSWGPVPLPFDLAPIGLPGCALNTRGDFITVVPNSGGSALWTVPVPNDPSLGGATFYDQVLVSEPGRLSTSNASAGAIW